jgi:hypothetical protein
MAALAYKQDQGEDRGYEHAIDVSDVSDTIRLTGVFADVKANRGGNRRPAAGPGWLLRLSRARGEYVTYET